MQRHYSIKCGEEEKEGHLPPVNGAYEQELAHCMTLREKYYPEKRNRISSAERENEGTVLTLRRPSIFINFSVFTGLLVD